MADVAEEMQINNVSDVFHGHQYINLTTFRKSGVAVPTPVWFVQIGDKLYVYTDPGSGKAKRIRLNGRARVAPSDARGTPLAEFLPARARLVQDEAQRKAIRQAFARKYGLRFQAFDLIGRLRGRRTVFIEVEPIAVAAESAG